MLECGVLRFYESYYFIISSIIVTFSNSYYRLITCLIIKGKKPAERQNMEDFWFNKSSSRVR